MNHQGISNNLNKFVILDACGGYWWRVQNIEILNKYIGNQLKLRL